MEKQKTCQERVKDRYQSRMDDLRIIWKADCEDKDSEELGPLNKYGLGFDYVEPKTFTDQLEGFYRYQLSTGGLGDEFRFFVNLDKSVHRIEYWFLDWFDGASLKLTGDDYDLLEEIYHWMQRE